MRDWEKSGDDGSVPLDVMVENVICGKEKAYSNFKGLHRGW